MKKYLIITLLSLFCIYSNAQYSGKGLGTPLDPYQIETPFNVDELRNFAGKEGIHFVITANIDMESFISENYGAPGWYPIPDFQGELNGDGHTITGLRMNRPSLKEVGFFSTATNAKISNLTIEYTGDIITGNHAGAFIAKSTNCEIYRCGLRAKDISSNNGGFLGGFIGTQENGYIKECSCCFHNLEVLLSPYKTYVGGLVGSCNHSIISDNRVYGNVSGRYYLGGIAADSFTSTLNNNLYEGNVYGKFHYDKGYYSGDYCGLCAYLGNSSANVVIADTICSDKEGGNIARISTNEIREVPSSPYENRAYVKTKMIKGEEEVSVTDNILNGLSTGLALLKQKSLYANMGWDMENIWTIDNGNSFPRLKWEVEEMPSRPVCPTPTVTYADGKLSFACECDEETVYHVSISSPDIKDIFLTENQLTIEKTYNVEVYATAPSYAASDIACLTIYWLDTECDINDCIEGVKAIPVQVSFSNGLLHITNVPHNAKVELYDLSGILLHTEVANSSNNIIINMQERHSYVIVKINGKSFKCKF